VVGWVVLCVGGWGGAKNWGERGWGFAPERQEVEGRMPREILRKRQKRSSGDRFGRGEGREPIEEEKEKGGSSPHLSTI